MRFWIKHRASSFKYPVFKSEGRMGLRRGLHGDMIRAGSRRPGRLLARLLGVCLMGLVPSIASAHGDLYLRIQDLTARIAAATNNVVPLYMERGELKREHGDPDGAQADFDSAAALDSGNISIKRYRGRLLVDRGKLQEAMALFNEVASATPGDPAVFIDRARLNIRLGDSKAAIADYKKGLEAAPEQPAEVYLEAAQVFAAGNLVTNALQALDLGVLVCGPQTQLESYAVDLELKQANTNGAIARIDRIIAHTLRGEKWWALRAELLGNAGQKEAARNAYESSLKAIAKLPPRLQQTPGMIELKAKVQTALKNLN